MPRPRRVLGYARVSSAEQALGTSLRDQQESIRAYAASLGLTVARFFARDLRIRRSAASLLGGILVSGPPTVRSQDRRGGLRQMVGGGSPGTRHEASDAGPIDNL